MSEARINLLDLDAAALEAWMLALGEKPFHARQILQWIYQKRVTDFAQMSNLSKSLRETLAAKAEIRVPQAAWAGDSDDGTRKWAFEMADGQRIETVFIPESGRGTLCVSSQVGCALDCKFCSTAQQGFSRDLVTAEIIGQVWAAAGDIGERRITNVVMMGMGEPLLNLKQVAPALRLMTSDLGFGLAKRRVTLSTSGVVPMIDKLREEAPVALAVSLHAADDDLRSHLVPINKKYPLAELMAACKRYLADDARAKITFEYVMLADINDSDQHAKALIRLMQGVPAKMNLIPFNPFPGTTYRRSPDAQVMRFRERLRRSGLVTTVRKTRGDDIDAACGQLVGRVADRGRRAQQRVSPEGLQR